MKQFFKFFFASVFGTIVAGFLSLAILFGILAIFASSGDDKVAVKENSILYMSLDEPMGDRTQTDPFENFDFSDFSTDPKIGLNDVLSNLDKAAEDDRIKGVFLDLTIVNVGMARMNEIRNALVKFKESGKFVYTYGEVLDQNAYYLATAGDKIFLNPGGLMQLSGLTSQRMFFKGSLEKLEIDVQVIRHGKFKSAVEPFTRENMSDENRLQTEAFVGSLWNTMIEEMSDSRKISVDKLNAYCDGLTVRAPITAVQLGLIDGVQYRDEVLDMMKSRLEIEEDEDLSFVSMSKYMNAPLDDDSDEKSLDEYKNKIAVVYASGDIVVGESEDGSMGSKTIAKAIEKARKNENVKAVVLRVNSPGGSSLASDIIWREVELTKEVKPVVVSMGNLAASGGYYISCGADKIIADPNTITGSIGVFGLVPNMGAMFKNKLGITFDTVNTNTYSDMGNGTRALKPVEEQYIVDMIERIYDDFVNKVAEGRNMTYAEVDSIGQGRVWSGTDALERGLVDELGGLERAMEIAREMGEVESMEVIEYPEQKDPFKSLMTDFSTDVESKMAKKYFGDQFERFNSVYQNVTQGGIFMRMPFDIVIE